MKPLTASSGMLIGGEIVASESGDWLESVDPATEEPIGRVPAGDERDIAKAVAAGERAWPAWHEMGVAGRAEAMRLMGRMMLERAEEILEVEVRDTGNTITPMRNDVRIGAEGLNYYAGLAYELKGETIPSTTPHNLHLTVREPYGVVARIVPFNHPVMFATARTAAALIAGNSVIVKPPETSSLSSLILSEIAAKALPAGVFNIVTGSGGKAGGALVRHPAVKRIAFIGSVQTGMAIQRMAAESAVKHVSLELGGKNPMIIFPDVDPAIAAEAAVTGMNFSWQGQSCGSTSRLLLHESIYESVVERLRERVRALRLGDPMDAATQMGPVNSKGQHEKVLRYIALAREEGAKLAAGGERPKGESFKRGYWVQPTLFIDVQPSMKIAREEVFGPVLSVMKWSTPDEALAIANSPDLGLTASIYTNDLNSALTMARRVRSGYVWINGVGTHFPAFPFGGMKNSGVGREEGIEEMFSYTETKAIHLMGRR